MIARLPCPADNVIALSSLYTDSRVSQAWLDRLRAQVQFPNSKNAKKAATPGYVPPAARGIPNAPAPGEYVRPWQPQSARQWPAPAGSRRESER